MKVAVAFVALLLSSCAGIQTDYEGADAGYAVIGIGATRVTYYGTTSFIFRRAGGSKSETGRFRYLYQVFGARGADYETSAERGVVDVASLAPGDYELVNFQLLNTGMVGASYSSKLDFSIPFQVRPKETVYLGNYQANRIMGKNVFGMTMPAGAFFVVEDRMKNDMALAKNRLPSLPIENARNATPNASLLGTPLLVTKEQARKIGIEH